MAGDKEKFVYYHYYPSLVAAIIFIDLFAVATILHLYQLAKTRTWCFIPFAIGGIFETSGYVGRAISSKESPNWTVGPYVIQSLLPLLGPGFFAASIYMILARIISLTDGEAHSVIRVQWLTKIFVTGDVLSFLAQSAGGVILAKADDEDKVKLGEHIIIAGLAIQGLFFGCFVTVIGIFHYRMYRVPTTASKLVERSWKQYVVILYFTSVLIIIRSNFRATEYVLGSDGALLQSEVYLYVFDATLMFLTMATFNIWHPSIIIARNERKGSERDPESNNEEFVMSG